MDSPVKPGHDRSVSALNDKDAAGHHGDPIPVLGAPGRLCDRRGPDDLIGDFPKLFPGIVT